MKILIGVGLTVALVTGIFVKGAASPGIALAVAESTSTITTAAVVSSVAPAPNSMSTGADDPIILTVSEPLDASTFDSGAFSVFGRWSGVARGRGDARGGWHADPLRAR